MSTWNDDVVVAHHGNTQASAMSIDGSGQLVVLGSRRHLTLIELSEPQKIVRRIHLTNKWDIQHLLWNPNLSQSNYMLSTYNQWADIWDFADGGGKCMAQLRGHTRLISDADWCQMDPTLCATSSLDTYIYIWDTRELKKHKLALSTVSGASQVKWNKLKSNCVATAHDGNIRVWDIRNTKTASHYVTAHLSKINSLDWHPSNDDVLASGGQDSTIRFWDVGGNLRSPSAQINLKYPLWKLSFTPFGTGLLSVEYASFRETPLTLRNIEDSSQVMQPFSGHSDVVLDYQVCNSSLDRSWRLVTWSKDQLLRVCKLSEETLLLCGTKKDDVPRLNLASDLEAEVDRLTDLHLAKSHLSQASSSSLESNASVGSYSSRVENLESPAASIESSTPSESKPVQVGLTSMQMLEQEFKLLNTSLKNLSMVEMDLQQRFCIVSLRTPLKYLMLRISFPPNYPNNEQPVFVFTRQSNIDDDSLDKLKATLYESAQHHVRNNRSCLEPCLRNLTTQFSAMTYLGEEEDTSETFDPPPWPFASALRHHQIFQPLPTNIPFPRTSGARFCSVGYLVAFLRPSHVRGYSSINEKTPRSYSSLSVHRGSTPLAFPTFRGNPSSQMTQYSTSPNQPDVPLSSFYYKEKRSSRKLKHFAGVSVGSKDPEQSSVDSTKLSRFQQYVGRVLVVDLTRILPVSRNLAKSYVIPKESNFTDACLFNKQCANAEEMDDLVELWSCVSLLPPPVVHDAPTTDLVTPFSKTPMGKPLVTQIMDHYCKQNDVQTLATLACTFLSKPQKREKAKPSLKTHTDNIRRSASYDTFRSERVKDKEIDGPMSKIFNILSRSPPSVSYMEHASRTISPITDRSETTDCDQSFGSAVKKKPNNSTLHENMLDESRHSEFEQCKHSYSDLLDRWRLPVKCTLVKKLMIRNPNTDPPSQYRASCGRCEDKCDVMCPVDKPRGVCVVCELPVEGLFCFCPVCQHGGHKSHLEMWFQGHDHCPTGCQCRCSGF